MNRELTFGEKAVGLTFNSGANAAVHDCKVIYAKAIDQLNTIRDVAVFNKDFEVARLTAVAITETQGAQMWAVKAITWGT